MFAANNIDVKTCFKAVTNANHETNIMAVANKQVDFATNNTENLAKVEMKDPEAFKKIKDHLEVAAHSVRPHRLAQGS